MKASSFLKDPLVSELFLSLSFHPATDVQSHWKSAETIPKKCMKFTKLSESLRRWALRTISCWWRKSCLCIQMAWSAVPSLLTSRVPFTSNHGWWHHVWPSVETGQICITVTFLGDVICTGYHDVCMTVRWNLTMNVSFENVQVSHSTLTALHINSMTA